MIHAHISFDAKHIDFALAHFAGFLFPHLFFIADDFIYLLISRVLHSSPSHRIDCCYYISVLIRD